MSKLACMYLRLSKEDGDTNESNSIASQRQIIESFAKNNDITITSEYVDDGYTGSNFNRPDFIRMIDDLNKKKFNIIIVKDLSRFGRDYIESGKYLQKIFPEKRVRFISVNDNYDSENADVSDTHLILPIRNFINDSYCRDISMKVKSSKEIKRKNGEFISAFAPFGYKKDDNNKHKLIIDKNVSHIVVRIFDMKIEGYSSKAIADFLNSIGEVTPGKYKEDTYVNCNGFSIKNGKWDAKMINRILENKVYIGILEQGKTTKLNYKSTRIVDVNKDDWIVIKDSHEPIISKSIFELANKMMLRDLNTSKQNPNLLSGMLYCKDCGSSMVRRKLKKASGEEIFYICSENNRTGGCSRHSIKETEILEALEYVLKNHINAYQLLLEKIKNIDFTKLEVKVDVASLEKEKIKYEKLRESLYLDLEDELISSEEFERYRKNYLLKIREIEAQISKKKEIVEVLKENISKLSTDNYKKVNEIDRLTLVSFVDKILIEEDNRIDVVLNNYEEVELLKQISDSVDITKHETKEKNRIINFRKVLHDSFVDSRLASVGGA